MPTTSEMINTIIKKATEANRISFSKANKLLYIKDKARMFGETHSFVQSLHSLFTHSPPYQAILRVLFKKLNMKGFMEM